MGLWENVGICDGFVGGSEGASVGMSVGMVYTEDLWVGLFGVSMSRTRRHRALLDLCRVVQNAAPPDHLLRCPVTVPGRGSCWFQGHVCADLTDMWRSEPGVWNGEHGPHFFM